MSLCSFIADAVAIFKKVSTNNDFGDYNRSDSKSNTINKKNKNMWNAWDMWICTKVGALL